MIVVSPLRKVQRAMLLRPDEHAVLFSGQFDESISHATENEVCRHRRISMQVQLLCKRHRVSHHCKPDAIACTLHMLRLHSNIVLVCSCGK